MKKTIRRWISLFLSALLALSFAAGAEEDPLAAGEANLADHGLTLDDVLSDYSGITRKSKGFPDFWLPYMPDGSPSFCLFDVTGDGCVDLCTTRMVGSGMVRIQLVVYDPLARERYILDGYNYDYVVRGVEDGRLVVMKRGPNGYGDPITETFGTVVLEDGRLVFVPDEPEP